MISVKVEQVSKLFGETLALDRIDLTIDPGELFFLLGPSGCGKTTLLRTLAGFYLPDHGRIYFGDDDVTRVEPHRRHTGMMFQSYALWPHMTVAENIAFGLEQQRLDKATIRERVQEALASVRMEQYGERKPNALSGGQQQRVALARALVVRPRCLLLDEPLSNLDAKLRNEMRREIRRICKAFKLTTIYVTHDQKEALSIADRMAVFSQGKLLQVGTPLEVYKRPQSRFVADFIGETNFIEGTLLRAEAGTALVKTPLGELSGVLAAPDYSPPDGVSVLVSMRPECIHLESMPAEENNLTGRIGESTYFGEVAHYLFETGGQTLRVSELNPRHLGAGREGDLYAWIDPEDVVVIDERRNAPGA